MSNNLLKSLSELVDAGVIDQATSKRISAFYQSKNNRSPRIITIVFSIMGAALIGLGIILVIAHNWDQLDRTVKTILAFIPLLAGQAGCAYTLLNKHPQQAWIEGSATFLFLSIGASISMVSQIYNIEGTLSGFLLTWMLLGLPLAYLMRSSMASLIYITGITWYCVLQGYFENRVVESYWYWFLLLLILPYSFLLQKNKPAGNFTLLHNWMIPVCITISLGTIANHAEELMFPAYMSLFALFYLIGENFFSQEKKLFINPFKLIGSTATLCLLMLFTFHWFWEDIYDKDFFNGIGLSPEFITVVAISLAAIVLLIRAFAKMKSRDFNPIEFSFLIFLGAFFFIGLSSSLISMVIMNLLVLTCGIYWIREGAKLDHLGLLNYGLLIVMILVACRFFDDYLSFVLRGLLFVTVGLLFFATNIYQLRKRKKINQH